MYSEQIEHLLTQLNRLKKADRAYKLFGSDDHRCELRKAWPPEDVSGFEQQWQVTLPEEYKAFLLLAGSGGAGPYYGLERPENGVFTDLDYKDEVNDVAGVFPYTEAWNDSCMNEEEREAFEADYFNSDKSAGLLRISNFGCGVSINLVVNGPAYGERNNNRRNGSRRDCRSLFVKRYVNA